MTTSQEPSGSARLIKLYVVNGIKPTGSNFRFQILQPSLNMGKKKELVGVSFLYVDGNMTQRLENSLRGPCHRDATKSPEWDPVSTVLYMSEHHAVLLYFYLWGWKGNEV